MVDWQPIETAPEGVYILLGFDGPFHDSECPGVAVGKLCTDIQRYHAGGWWLTAIWAASVPFKPPVRWAPLPTEDTE